MSRSGDHRAGLRGHEPDGRRDLRRLRLAGGRDDVRAGLGSRRAANHDASAVVDD